MGEKLSIFVFYKSVFVSGIIMALILGWELALISLISLPVSTIIMGLVAWVQSNTCRSTPIKRHFVVDEQIREKGNGSLRFC